MDAKMQRFLNSMQIENIDSFDLSLDFVAWTPDKTVLRMAITKDTPWSYIKLRQFQDGLNTLTYQYQITFSYRSKVTASDAAILFPDWYQTIYRLPSNVKVFSKDDKVCFTFASKEEKKQYEIALRDFKEFLHFINYYPGFSTSIDESLLPKEEETNDEKVIVNEEKEVVEVPIKEAEEEIVEEVKEEKDEKLEEVEEEKIEDKSEHEKQIDALEKANIKEMEETLKAMKLEQINSRKFKKGNYLAVEDIGKITVESGNVSFSGIVFGKDVRSTRKGKRIVTFGVGDKSRNAIYCTYFVGGALTDELTDKLKDGNSVWVKGAAQFDTFRHEMNIFTHFIGILPPDELRKDEANDKRVELHLHTKMSSMDGVATIQDYIATAKSMGHKAIALTDHGVVQSFPDAQYAAKKAGIKILYGCELYMIEDNLNYIQNPSDIKLSEATYVIFDFETTGLSAKYNKIIEFGAVKVKHGMIIDSIDLLVNPKESLTEKICDLTGITDEMLVDKPDIKTQLKVMMDFIGDSVLVTHNTEFDISFLNQALLDQGFNKITNPVIDTLDLSRYFFPQSRNHRLGTLCNRLEVEYNEDEAHRADYDATVLNNVFQMILSKLGDEKCITHRDVGNLKVSEELYPHLRAKHVTVLVKNKAGLKDLYKIISISHIKYYSGIPRVPRSVLVQYRENLLVGSACFNGEIFDLARTRSEETVKKAMQFYDYIEVQPKSNYSYLVNMGDLTEKEVDVFLKDIVRYSSEINKMVVATGDCHYVNPEDKIYRDVYVLAKAVGNASHPLNPPSRAKVAPFENPDQYYRDTNDMLKCFEFLGEDKAKEIVVTNTNKIADLIESITPIPDKLFTPNIENCENMLTDMCYTKAHELYGDELPEIVKTRLDKELHGIISNGYSVIYYIAHEIIKKSNEDGYMVGSRGSVGSSFVATMASITEVNPLPPHYRCPKCKHFELNEDHSYFSGYDLPKKKCPICGEEMVRDGQNIPFETFLGFNADKVPDIDLNFPRDYQATAHNYTKVLLGEQNVFRAGTISTVAEKTAYGFVKGYFERSGINPDTVSRAKIAFLAVGCTDVKRTTGQHPGGIVVIPSNYEVYDFTPIQYPADDLDANWKTTHFAFSAIHDTVLKLDLLGHLDPMALKMMADISGVDVLSIPMNDPNVLSIFSSNQILKQQRNYLQNTTGALGIPEFGTNFVRGILKETQPQTFSDLLIISGLSHGTDVWSGNAEELILKGTCKLRDVIGCRDDIMTYLISKGLPSALSFSIMEDVRHGKKVKEEFEKEMKKYDVPQYYIDSCNKIKYMFPKAHATAYVMMAIRVAWFKVYRPLEYYAAYFSIRCDKFDIKAMIDGEEAMIKCHKDIQQKKMEKTNKPADADIEDSISTAIEMSERGFKVLPLDLNKSLSNRWVVDKERNGLIPPFDVLDGVGDAAAESVIEAREKDGEFISIEDLQERTKLSSTNIKMLESLGVLKGLSESNQMSLFDLL